VISAWSSSIDADAFQFSSSFPITMPPLGSATAQITYVPSTTAKEVKYRHGLEIRFPSTWDGNSCTQTTLTFAGTAIEPTSSGTATPLFPDEKQILAFVGTMQPTVKTFHFINNTPSSLKIISVSMKNGTSFRINNVTPSNTFPFDLAAGANMTVDVEMFNVTQGVHYDELIIVVDKAADALHFELQGLQKQGAASVRNSLEQAVELAVYPNPTSGTTTFLLSGADRGELEIVDVLGNILYRSPLNTMLIWNGSSLSNTQLLPGSYIARVRSSEAARPFITSKIFIVQ
jgi:hypothetical protein